MVGIQEISVSIAAVGVFIAAINSILASRRDRKNQSTRLYMDLYQGLYSEEGSKKWIDLMNMEWENYDEFERKYGSDNNPENYAKRMSLWRAYDGIGFLLKEGLIDSEMVYQLEGTSAIWQWLKFESVIKEGRRRYRFSTWLRWFEYLAEEMIRMRKERGDRAEIPKTFTKYIPDKTE